MSSSTRGGTLPSRTRPSTGTHRIGQTRKILAYRLLIKDSIEEKIRQLQRTKSSLAAEVLGEERFSEALTLDDLKFLLAEPARES